MMMMMMLLMMMMFPDNALTLAMPSSEQRPCRALTNLDHLIAELEHHDVPEWLYPASSRRHSEEAHPELSSPDTL